MTTKIYAVAPDTIPADVQGYLTAGKKYEATPTGYDNFDGAFGAFNATDDAGVEMFCLWEGCAHLDGGDWKRVEEDDDKPKGTQS